MRSPPATAVPAVEATGGVCPVEAPSGPTRTKGGARLSARDNAYGRAERLARVVVTVEQRTDRDDALRRLKEIAQEWDAPATYLEIGGWPALQRRNLSRRALKGNEALQEPTAEDKGRPERLNLNITTAIAAGSLLIRVEGTMPPNGGTALEYEIEAIGRSVRTTEPGNPVDAGQAIEQLRAAPPPSRPEVVAEGRVSAELGGEPPAAGPVTALPDIGATQRPLTGASEIEIAASTDGRYVVVGTNGGYAYSGDGGRTFTASSLACPAGFDRCNGDPSLAVGRSGAFYYAIIGFPTDGTNATTVYRSANNGQTFTFRANAVVCNDEGAGSCFADQEHITADRNFAGTGGDQVYSTWRNFDATDQDPALVCSQDGGQTWTAPLNVGAGFVPRIGIGADGFVYVIYRSGGNIMLHKFEQCRDGMDPVAGFPRTVTAVSDVTCPVPGLDRCNDGNILSSHTVAPSDTNPQQIFVAYATNTTAGINENVLVRASIDGGTTWDAGRVVRVNTLGDARRYMPWVCTAGGSAYVTWYDRRFANPVSANDLTDFFGGSASLDGGGTLSAGAEFRITQASDPNCSYGGGPWPCAPRATTDAESCSDQPQLAGVCRDGDADDTDDSFQRCDFSSGPACPAGESCQTGGGCPTYGDYNGNACAGGRLFMAWASRTPPPSIPASGGAFPDTFVESRLVCCVPQIQAAGNVNFGATCSGTPVTRDLEVCNNGAAPLEITGITSSSAQFTVTTPVPAFPVSIAEGNCSTFQVTFAPTSPGAKSGTISITSNDPVYPTLAIQVQGTAGQADINVTGSGEFGEVCAGVVAENTINVCNTGTCALTVSDASPSCADFTIVNNPFPAPVEAGECVPLTVAYTPTSLGAHSCTLDITSLDPDESNVHVPLHGTTPAPVLTMGPSFAFPPTVIQSIGACESQRPVVITNAGVCPVMVNSVAIGGDNAADFSLEGLPTPPPVTLSPGHQLGEGDLRAIFRPTELDRDRLGTLAVEWVSNPITASTASISRDMCGEGVRTGARVLVNVGGAPTAMVERIQLKRITANRNKKIVDTVDVSQDLALQSVTPAAPCPAFSFHKEYGTIDSPLMLAPGSYTVTATTRVDGRRHSKTVAFDTDTCGFNPTIVVEF